MNGLIIDLFAGGGGASAGIEAALGRPVDIAINHDPVALAVHKANHPHTRHVEEDIWKAKPQELVGSRRVALLWASPDCTHFSVAKGGKPRQKKIRSLAWAVVRWAAAVKPAVIFLENVTEFQGWGPLTRDGRPDKRYMGRTFKAWKRKLERLGYEVEYRILDASLYGAPTKRKRLFLIARRDGLLIVWPEITHGKGKLPLHTAAECIDWSLACPSIFERKKPLAEKTLWRIRQGLKRFVFETANPFIVGVGGRAAQSDPTSAGAPVGTITAKNDRALVTPHLIKFRGDAHSSGMASPVPTITAGPAEKPAGAAHALGIVAPHLVKVNHGKDDARGESLEAPLTTVTAQRRGHALITPTLITIDNQSSPRGFTAADAPLPTTTTENRHALIAPTLVQTGYGEREGQAPRALDLQRPLGTVVAGAAKHALVAAFLEKGYGELPNRWPGAGSQSIEKPAPTITVKDHTNIAAASLIKIRGDCNGAELDQPLPTVTAGGFHLAEVRAFLTAYYGTDGTKGKGQALTAPMRALTARHRLGLVTVEGTDYQIVDIGMRMLQPHELLRAQFGRFASSTDLSVARTKAAMVRLIGNSVCPEVAEAIVAANHATSTDRKVAA